MPARDSRLGERSAGMSIPMKREEQLVSVWKNADGSYGSRHVSVEDLRAEALQCGERCSCWRHRVLVVEDLQLWEEDL